MVMYLGAYSTVCRSASFQEHRRILGHTIGSEKDLWKRRKIDHVL